MALILDLIIIVIIIFMAWRGYANGLFRALAGFLGTVAAFLAARFIAGIITPALSNILPIPAMGTKLTSFVRSTFLGGAEGMSAADILKKFGMPDNVAEAVGSRTTDVGANANEAIDNISKAIDYYISYIIIFIALFIVLLILVKILTSVLDSVMKLPVLNLANRIGGVALGVFGGFAVAFCVTVLISWLMPLLDSALDIKITADVIENTAVFKFFAGFNPFKFIV